MRVVQGHARYEGFIQRLVNIFYFLFSFTDWVKKDPLGIKEDDTVTLLLKNHDDNETFVRLYYVL